MNTTGYTNRKKQVALLLLWMLLLPVMAQDIEGGGIESPPLGGFSRAEKLYNEFSYHEAIPVYEHYLEKHDSARAMLQLGDCYRLTSDFSKAMYWYGKGLEKGGEVEAKYKLYYAQMLQAKENYAEAAKWYASYVQSVPEDKRAGNQLKSSGDPGQYQQTKGRYEITNLSFNSTGYDFAPSWNGKGLIYSSSRDSAKAISRQSTWTGTQFFDMYFSEGSGTSFGKPKAMEGDAATKYHEANASFTPDSTKVYFTRNNYYNGKTGTSSVGKIIKLDIYSSEVDGTKWTNDQEFEYNNDEYSVGHPALTPDGQTLYFVSDMPGGYGGTDLYVTRKDGEKWGTPQNLGSAINTEGMEMFPYVDKEGTLYFASDGQGGLGGLDNFKVKWNADTKTWGKIKNIGAPVNSSYDDFGLVYGPDKSRGYFTSNRPGGKGSDDIYSFEDKGIDLEGIVVDAKTGKPICKSSVTMLQKTTEKKDGPKQTECDGRFEFGVLNNTDYCFEATAEGYLPNNTVCATTKGVKPGETVFVKIPLQKDDPTGLVVQVVDKATKEPIASAKVALSNNCIEKVEESETDGKGETCYMVKCGCDYVAMANAQGYLPGSGTGSTRDKCPQVQCSEGGGDTIIVELEKIEIKSVELKDIYYDFDKWNIRPESETQLNVLLGFLKENADAIVEIASHTDARAPYDYNIRLSQKRAQSVVDWLVSHGIERSRLKPKGYGETKPRNNCTDDVKCSEYEHQRNRRTEFQVIGGDIDIKSLERFDMQVDPCKVCPF